MEHFQPAFHFLMPVAAEQTLVELLLGEGWGECRMRVVSRWAAAVAAASMANCLMARSSRYFCSHLVISASSARICSSFSRSCSDSRRALSSGIHHWHQWGARLSLLCTQGLEFLLQARPQT